MTLLVEYALSPDVFDETCYGSPDLCGVHLQALKEILLQEALVRDLRDGEWGRLFLNENRSWHRRGKELLKKIVSARRLVSCGAAGAAIPATDADWCNEALATHLTRSLRGIIVSDGLAVGYRGNALVGAIGSLANAPWWSARSPSVRLGKTRADYQNALDPVLRHANSMMVIDPHLNPSEPRYHDIVAILQGAAGRTPLPLIEIHRVAWFGNSRDKTPRCAEIEAFMRAGLGAAAARSGLSFEVFLWDDFHDRYLISNLIGISVPFGFDTTRGHVATTWTRLGRANRDDVQREFDQASADHALRHRFTVR